MKFINRQQHCWATIEVERLIAAAVVRFRAKMRSAEARQIYRQRAAIAEFPNAWIKEKFGLHKFRVRGLAQAALELIWAALTYNILLCHRLRRRPSPIAAAA